MIKVPWLILKAFIMAVTRYSLSGDRVALSVRCSVYGDGFSSWNILCVFLFSEFQVICEIQKCSNTKNNNASSRYNSALNKLRIKQSCTSLDRFPGGSGFQISRQSTHEGCNVVSPVHRLPLPSRKYFWYSFLLGRAVA